MKLHTHSTWMFIALAVATTTAQAEDNYTLYGKARMSVNSSDNGSTRANDVASNSSRLGFKGTEDLGNGLRAIFQMETLVTMDGSDTLLFGTPRNSYIGLAGGFGTLMLGNHDNPYKIATSKLDNWSDSMGDFNAMIGNVSGATTPFNEREPNSINYWSQKMNGLQFKAAYRLDETDSVNRDRYSANATYDNGPFYVGVAYEKHREDNVSGASGNDTDGLTIGAAYAFNEEKTKLGLIYESLSEDNINSVLDRDLWYLALAHKIGNNTFKVAYANAGDNDTGNNTGADWYVLGLDHALSKRTSLYALYAATENDAGAKYGLGTGGSSGNVKNSTAGLDLSTFSVGINHDF